MNRAENIVVVGCSGCGAIAAQMLKQLSPATNVTIIREPEESGLLTRCGAAGIICRSGQRADISCC